LGAHQLTLLPEDKLAISDTNADAGTDTDTDTDTDTTNPSEKGTVPFFKGLILCRWALAKLYLSSLVLGFGFGRTEVRPNPKPKSR
jgi:hypothetical protein